MNLVVARHSENVDWTKKFDNVIIYNKGEKLNWDNEFMLSNTGREGHSFYTYICNNYDNLNYYTMFVQGNPFDHSPNFLDFFRTIHVKDFEWVSEYMVETNLNGDAHYGLPLIYIYEKLFNKTKHDNNFKFGSGGQFMVSRNAIRQRPLHFYQKIVRLLDHDINPIEGFCIERFHELIFTTF